MEKKKGSYDLREVTSTISNDFKWLTTTKFIETYWDKHQRKQIDFYDLADLYHENTKMRRHLNLQVGLSTDVFMRRPTIIESVTKIYKTYPTHPRIDLPLEGLEISRSLDEVLQHRRSTRKFTGEPASLKDVAKIMYYSNGITHRLDFDEFFTKKRMRQFFRAAPSGGGLYPVEIYIGVNNVEGLSPGIYHYNVFDHCLETLLTQDNFTEEFCKSFPIHPEYVQVDKCAFVFILTAMFSRSKAKYGPRSYRFCLQESGHITQNALIVAAACDLGSVALAGFYDDELNDWLNIDGVDEAVLYATSIGRALPADGMPVSPKNFREIVKSLLNE
jgi:SagB-type dehydrogenase family enzyme